MVANADENKKELVKVKEVLSGKYKDIPSLTEDEKGQDNSSDESKSLEREDDVVLFFSYDIVNSTRYKTVNRNRWSVVIAGIIETIQIKVKAAFYHDVKVWRVQGDEVLFVLRIKDITSIYSYVDKIYALLLEICRELEDEDLSLKAAAWLAIVTKKDTLGKDSSSERIENLYESIQEEGNYKLFEFIGIDIDTGFRVAGYTRSKQLAISFELAYILCQNEKMCDNIILLALRKLKGVWEEKDYPILWYYNAERNNKLRFEESLPYDAISQDDLFKDFFLIKYSKMYDSVKAIMEKILKELKLRDKIDRIKRTIQESASNTMDYIDTPKLELHCAVVCINDYEQALVVKRGSNKDLSGKWEVGCAKASSRQQLINTIKEEYRKDFSIEIELLCDDERKDRQPHPISIYTYPKGNECHIGIVFVATIVSGEVKLDDKKHSELQFISENEIGKLDDDNCVPDLKDTLKKAFLYYKSKKTLK